MDRREIRQQLEAHLRYLSVTLGERSIYRPANLKAAENYVFDRLAAMGYAPRRQTFVYLRQQVSNIIAGEAHPQGYYILGAHYDTVAGTPGADDNASGVAVLLEVARLTLNLDLPRPWTFIGFTCEEPPAFFTPYMGSRVYAKAARKQGHKILGMLCLEMVGYYSQTPGSQELPVALRFMGYPTTGNFIGLASDRRSKPLMTRLAAAIKAGWAARGHPGRTPERPHPAGGAPERSRQFLGRRLSRHHADRHRVHAQLPLSRSRGCDGAPGPGGHDRIDPGSGAFPAAGRQLRQKSRKPLRRSPGYVKIFQRPGPGPGVPDLPGGDLAPGRLYHQP